MREVDGRRVPLGVVVRREGLAMMSVQEIKKVIDPPMSRFGGGNRQEKKKTVIEKIQAFFERYFGL